MGWFKRWLMRDDPPSHRALAVSYPYDPDPALYTESECFVAGRLSTMPPFDTQHPSAALPYARAALEALSEWEPAS